MASAKEFQGDYERRLRELRMLGWDYKPCKRYGEGSTGQGLLPAGPVRRPGPRTYGRPSPRRRTGARPDGPREGTLPAQTACNRFCRPVSALSRATWIARWILMPTARATGGGKAFPICLYAAVLRP